MQISNAMKRFSQCIGTLVALGLVVACTSEPTPSGDSAPTGANTDDGAIATAPTINEFDFNEIAGSGCGMTLLQADRSPQDRQYVLFNGLVQQSPSDFDVRMEMKIDDEIIIFNRTDYQGEPFAVENYPLQTFVSKDGSLVATVEVEAVPPAAPVTGAPGSGETEVVTISGGTVSVDRDGQSTSVSVVGDAGC